MPRDLGIDESTPVTHSGFDRGPRPPQRPADYVKSVVGVIVNSKSLQPVNLPKMTL